MLVAQGDPLSYVRLRPMAANPRAGSGCSARHVRVTMRRASAERITRPGPAELAGSAAVGVLKEEWDRFPSSRVGTRAFTQRHKPPKNRKRHEVRLARVVLWVGVRLRIRVQFGALPVSRAAWAQVAKPADGGK